MSTNFPGSVDDGVTLPNPGANAPTNNPSLSAGQTNQNDAIKAVEAKIGTGASTPVANRVFRGTGTGTSAWAQLVLTTDVTGTLPVANGGTGVTTLTVPASAILVGTTDAQDLTAKTLHDTFMGTTFMSQSATFCNVVLDASVDYLVTQLAEIGAAFNLEVPATSSLEIQPIHGPQGFANAQHDHTNAAGGGILTFAALLSTIFSGQVQSYANGGNAGGTFYYINLGGIKLLWGMTAQLAFPNSYAAWIVNMPNATFFTTIQMAIANLAGAATAQQQQGIAVQGITPSTSVTIESWTAGAGQSSQVSLFMIGT